MTATIRLLDGVFVADEYAIDPGGFVRATGRFRCRVPEPIDEDSNEAHVVTYYGPLVTWAWPREKVKDVRDG